MIYQAYDVNTGQQFVVKAAKSHLNKKYHGLLKKEYAIMSERLSGLQCIVRPITMTRDLVHPTDFTQDAQYFEDFMVMEYASYGSL